jgi:hypothetical protein
MSGMSVTWKPDLNPVTCCEQCARRDLVCGIPLGSTNSVCRFFRYVEGAVPASSVLPLLQLRVKQKVAKVAKFSNIEDAEARFLEASVIISSEQLVLICLLHLLLCVTGAVYAREDSRRLPSEAAQHPSRSGATLRLLDARRHGP